MNIGIVGRGHSLDEPVNRVGDPATGRCRLVTDIVEGRAVDEKSAEDQLGVGSSQAVVALLLWIDRTAEEFDQDYESETLRRFASLLGEVLGSSRSIAHSLASGRLLVWVTWTGVPPPSLESCLSELSGIPAGLKVSVGPAGWGIAGMRRSHVGAREAARVARDDYWTRGRWIVEYKDVAIVAMLTQDPVQARWLVDETLGPLARGGRDHDELRETLRVYLAYGRSRLQASQRLFVARNTVAYRVAKAVRLLGRPICADPVTLRLALEIARVLPNPSTDDSDVPGSLTPGRRVGWAQ